MRLKFYHSLHLIVATLLSGDMQESLQSVISTPGSPSLAPSFPSVHMLEFVDILSLDRPVNPVHATDLECRLVSPAQR